jgi:hypothetical protein
MIQRANDRDRRGNEPLTIAGCIPCFQEGRSQVGGHGPRWIRPYGCRLESTNEPRAFSATDLRPNSDQWKAVQASFSAQIGFSDMNNASIGVPPDVVAQAVADGYRAQSEDSIGFDNRSRLIQSPRRAHQVRKFRTDFCHKYPLAWPNQDTSR